MLKYLGSIFCIVIVLGLSAKNPVIPNKGANDQHIRIIDGKAYLSAFDIPNGNDKLNLCFVFKGKGDKLLCFDSFAFQ
jgi:hypothetical protein